MVAGHKTCTECGETKPLSEFNKHRKAKDGYQTRCRSCFSAYNKRRYAADPERHKANVHKYKAANADKVLETRKKICADNPTHFNAHKVVEAAVIAGEIQRPDFCHGCGCSDTEHRIEAHHARYDRPLEVSWLCTPCHYRMDQRRREREQSVA